MTTATVNNVASCESCGETADTFKCTKCDKVFCFSHLQAHREEVANKVQVLQDELNTTRETMNHFKENINQHPLMKTINDWEKKSILKIQQLAEDRRQILQYHITEHLSTMEKSWKNVEMKMQGLLEEQEFDKNYVYQCNTELKQLKTQINEPLKIIIQEDLTPFISILQINLKEIKINNQQPYSNSQVKSDIGLTQRRPFYDSISRAYIYVLKYQISIFGWFL